MVIQEEITGNYKCVYEIKRNSLSQSLNVEFHLAGEVERVN